MDSFCYYKLNWILNLYYNKLLGFTNSYIFDDRFNWCPFLFNVVIIIMNIFFLLISNFKNLKHYPYDGFVTICCSCF
jgi:hypothetical protein